MTQSEILVIVSASFENLKGLKKWNFKKTPLKCQEPRESLKTFKEALGFACENILNLEAKSKEIRIIRSQFV